MNVFVKNCLAESHIQVAMGKEESRNHLLKSSVTRVQFLITCITGDIHDTGFDTDALRYRTRYILFGHKFETYLAL